MAAIPRKLMKLLDEPGVSGFSISGNQVIIYVESDDVAKTLVVPRVEGFEVKIEVSGKFEFL